MRTRFKVALVVCFVLSASLLWHQNAGIPINNSLFKITSIWAQDSQDTEQSNGDLKEITEKIKEYESKINELQQEKNSLASTIAVINNKILLNEAEITKTERQIQTLELQINDLSDRIEGLELSLGELSKLLVERIQRQYKQYKIDPVASLIAADGLGGFIKEQRYLKQTRSHTEDLMLTTEYKRQVYDEEKQNKEEKQQEVELLSQKLQSHRNELALQKNEKQALLDQTRNSEQEYRKLLAQAKAEAKAIEQALVSSIKVGPVKKGDPIALVGNSGYPGCSTGPHLHFEVRKDNVWVDPTSYLSSRSILDVDQGSNRNLGSGDWEWPIQSPIRVTQHYGKTPYSWRYTYSGGIHTGIDLTSLTSNVITAPADGELYSSSQSCGNSSTINIRYIDHGDDIKSFYLHVQ